MILMIAPGPFMGFGAMPSGQAYASDQYSLIRITNDSAADQAALQGVGCFTLSPFGGWGNFAFMSLADLYAADEGSLLPSITGFPQYTVASVFADPSPGNVGTWAKTSSGNGSGAWTQVSTQTLATIAATVANDVAIATAQAGYAQVSANAAQSSAATAGGSAGAAAISATLAASEAATAISLATALATAGATRVFPSYAAASAALGGMSNGTMVQVIVDETRNGDWTVYEVVSAALSFIADIPEGLAAFIGANTAQPIVRSAKAYARTWAEAISMAEDLSEMVGYAAYASTTGGQGYPVLKVWNASNDESVPGSLPYQVAQQVLAGGGIIVVSPFGQFDIYLDAPLIPGPNLTLAAPGRNCRIFADAGINQLQPAGANNVVKWISFLRPPMSTAGDAFDYGDGFQPPGMTPVTIATGDGSTASFALPAGLTVPVLPYTCKIIVAGVTKGTDVSALAINSGGVAATFSPITGAFSIAFPSAPASGAALGVYYNSSTAIATGNGSTTAFTGTVNASAVHGTLVFYSGATALGGDDGSGNIKGPGISGTGTYNSTTGAVAFTAVTAPGMGVAVSANYAVNHQFATGDGSTTSFGPFTLGLPFVGTTLHYLVAGVYHGSLAQPASQSFTDGTVSSTVGGSMTYATGVGTVTFTTPPASGALIQLAYSSAAASTAGDNIHLDPSIVDKTWAYQCTLQSAPDGMIDLSSSQVLPGMSPCRITVQQCSFRLQDKNSLVGSTASHFIPLGTTPTVLASYNGNVFEGCGSRNPRLGSLGFGDIWNNLYLIAPHIRPDGSHGNITGIEVADPSGQANSRGNLFVAAFDQTAYTGATAANYQATTGYPGALKSTGDVSIGADGQTGDGLSILAGNQSYVTTPPYSATVNAVPTPGTLAMGAYIAGMLASAGAERAPLSELDYTFVPWATALTSALVVDGYNVVTHFGATGAIDGVLVRTFDPIQAMTPTAASGPEGVVEPTQTVAIVGGVVTLTQQGDLYQVGPRTGQTSDTFTNITTDGSFSFVDGQEISLQLDAASHTLTASGAGTGEPGSIMLPVGFLPVMSGYCGILKLRYFAAGNSGLGSWIPVAIPFQGLPPLPAVGVTIASSATSITLPDPPPIGDMRYAVALTGGTAATINNIVTDGSWQPQVGQRLYFYPNSSSYVVTFANGSGSGAISLTAEEILLAVQDEICLVYTTANTWRLVFGPPPTANVATPTYTSVLNCAATPTNASCKYVQSGPITTVSGAVTAHATAASKMTFTAPVPILSSAADAKITGMILGDSGTAIIQGVITGSGGLALFTIYPPDTSSHTYEFEFSYSSQ